MSKKTVTFQVGRDAGNGRFITVKEADRRPERARLARSGKGLQLKSLSLFAFT